MDITSVLEGVKSGALSVQEAQDKIRYLPLEDLKYAVIDYHRELRTGAPEVIYGAGKTVEQITGIVESMKRNKAERLLITRVTQEAFAPVRNIYENAIFHEQARAITAETGQTPKNKGRILIITGGTSDMDVSEEAAVTAEFLGNNIMRMYDVGVAGIHRLLSRLDELKQASVIIVVAGMEGALASVVGGLTDKPVIAVPTSVGYGANLGGVATLLSMLNSCASGVAVVNIDNGFGAGFLANNINKLSGKQNGL